MDLKPTLHSVVGIACEAGQSILKYYRQSIKIKYKNDNSPLTLADKAANKIILKQLSLLDKTIPIVSEEAAIPRYSTRSKWKRFWLVDPLDGTKEFIKGKAEFTVNIALIDNLKPVLGVVYAPAKKSLYYAAKGLGSWFKELRHHNARARRIYAKPYGGQNKLRVAVSASHLSPKLACRLKTLPSLKCISIGSSLKLCYLAQGKVHLYPRLAPTMEWDVAAGDAIFRYASNKRPHYSPLKYNKQNLKNGPFVLGPKSHALRQFKAWVQ